MQFFTSEKNRTSSSHGKNSKQYDKHVKFKHEFHTNNYRNRPNVISHEPEVTYRYGCGIYEV